MQDRMIGQATQTSADAGGGQQQMMQQIVQALVSLGDPRLIAKVAEAAIQMLQNSGQQAQPAQPAPQQ
jgi:hypothetical protein